MDGLARLVGDVLIQAQHGPPNAVISFTTIGGRTASAVVELTSFESNGTGGFSISYTPVGTASNAEADLSELRACQGCNANIFIDSLQGSPGYYYNHEDLLSPGGDSFWEGDSHRYM